MENEDITLINQLTKSGNDSEDYSVLYSYICNPDGTIRWMYPKKLKKPTFLKFYNSSTFKSKIYRLFILILFELNILNFFFARKIDLTIQKGSLLDQINNNDNFYEHTIFFGTIGINRKLIFSINKSNKKFSFIKVATSKQSQLLITNEHFFLSKLSKLATNNFISPEIICKFNDNAFEISDIKPSPSSQPTKLNQYHINTIYQINSIDKKIIRWPEISIYDDFDDLFTKIKIKEIKNSFITSNFVEEFLDNSRRVLSFIKIDETVMCGLFHGDLTPWNMYFNKENKIHLYDWELAKTNMPYFLDLFHFIFQSNILLKNSKFSDFKQELINLKNNKLINKYIKMENNINIDQNYIFYIVFISSYYLNLYLDQENIHKQALWQVECWNDALLDSIKFNGILTHEK